MMYLNYPVYYLTNADISDDGSITNSHLKDKSIFCMIQSNFCGYCTLSKPAFQEASEDMKNKVIFVTIQGDGKEQDEPVSMTKIKAMCNGDFKGFPTYVGKTKNKSWQVFNGGRSKEDIIEFAKKL